MRRGPLHVQTGGLFVFMSPALRSSSQIPVVLSLTVVPHLPEPFSLDRSRCVFCVLVTAEVVPCPVDELVEPGRGGVLVLRSGVTTGLSMHDADTRCLFPAAALFRYGRLRIHALFGCDRSGVQPRSVIDYLPWHGHIDDIGGRWLQHRGDHSSSSSPRRAGTRTAVVIPIFFSFGLLANAASSFGPGR